MRRGHTIESYIKKIDRIKASSKSIALTTDIIVGFPGETEADFQDTIDAVEYCGYDAAYMFKYSPRPGTPAFKMTDDVSAEAKTDRYLRLEMAQRASQARLLERYRGTRLSVLVEKASAKRYDELSGHSTCHKVVNFAGSADLLGKIVNVEIEDIKANSLFGRLV